MRRSIFLAINSFLIGLLSSNAYAQGSISASFVDRKGDALTAPANGNIWCNPTSGGASANAAFSQGATSVLLENVAPNSYSCSVGFTDVSPSYVAFRTSTFSVQAGATSSTSVKLAALDSSASISVADQFGDLPTILNGGTGWVSCSNWQSGLYVTKSFTSLPVTLSLLSNMDYYCSIGQFASVGGNGYASFNTKLNSGESREIAVTAYKTNATLQVSVVDQFGNPATFNGNPSISCSSRDLPSLWFSSNGSSLPASIPVVGGYSYSCSAWGLTGHVSSYANIQTGTAAAGATLPVEIVAAKPDSTLTVNLQVGGVPLVAPSPVYVSCWEQTSGSMGIAISGTVAQNSSSVSIPALSGRKYYCSVPTIPGYGRLDYRNEITLGDGQSGSITFRFESLLGTLNVQLVAQESGTPLVVPDGSWGWVSCDSESTNGRSRYFSSSINPGQSSVSFSVKENLTYNCRVNSFGERVQVDKTSAVVGSGGTTSLSIPLKQYDSAIVVSFAAPDGTTVIPTVPQDGSAEISCSSSVGYTSRQVQSGVATVSLPAFAGETYQCNARGILEGYGMTSDFVVPVPTGASSQGTVVTVYPRNATIEVQTLLLAADGTASKFERSFDGGSGYFSCYGTATDFSFEGRLPNGSQPVSLLVVPGKYQCSANAPSGFVAVSESSTPVSAATGRTASATQYYKALTGTLKIQIIDDEGNPVVVPPENSLGFYVYPKDGSFWLESEDFQIEEQQSESSGAVVPGETYTVEVESSIPGYARPLRPTEVEVPATGSATATITLRRLNASVTVSLVGPDGQPYPVPTEREASIECSSDLHSAYAYIAEEQVSADVPVIGSADKPYVCRAWIGSVATKATTVTVTAGETGSAQIDILELNAPLTVQLVDAVTGNAFTGVPNIETGFYSLDSNVSHEINLTLAADTGSASGKLAGGVPYSMWASLPNSVVDGVFELNGKSYLLLDRSLNFNPAANQDNVVKLRILEARATFTAKLVDSTGNPVPGWVNAQAGLVSDDAPGIGASVPPSGEVRFPIGVGQQYFVRAFGYGDSPISAAVFSTTPGEGENVIHTFVIPTSDHELTISLSTSDGRDASYSCNAKNDQGMQTWGHQQYLGNTIQMYLTTGSVWTIRCEGWFHEGNSGTQYGIEPVVLTPEGTTGARSIVLNAKGSYSRSTTTVSSTERVEVPVSSETSLDIEPGALGNGNIDLEVETRAPLATNNVPPGTEAVRALTITANNGGNPLTQFNRSITAEFLVDEGGDFSAVHCTDATSCTQLPINSVTAQTLSKLGVPEVQVRKIFTASRGKMAAKYLVKVAVSRPGQLALARKKNASAPPTPTPGISVGAVGNLKVKVNRKDRSATVTWAPPTGQASANYTLTLSWKDGKKNKSKVVRTSKTKYVFRKLKPRRYKVSLVAAVSSTNGPSSTKNFSVK